jgi:hypothetical protein
MRGCDASASTCQSREARISRHHEKSRQCRMNDCINYAGETVYHSKTWQRSSLLVIGRYLASGILLLYSNYELTTHVLFLVSHDAHAPKPITHGIRKHSNRFQSTQTPQSDAWPSCHYFPVSWDLFLPLCPLSSSAPYLGLSFLFA